MTILFISPSFPSRLHRIRAWQLLTELTKLHTVHLVTHSWGAPPEKEWQELNERCASVTIVRESQWRGRFRAILGIFRTRPLEVSYYDAPGMHHAVAGVLEKEPIDLVYAKRIRSVHFISHTKLPVVVDATDAMSMFYVRAASHADRWHALIYASEAKRYARYERSLAKRFIHWIVCSPVDAAYLRTELPSIAVTVLPNGVDTNYFVPATLSSDPNELLMTGLLDKFVNYEAAEYFVKDILPKIVAIDPGVHISLVGPAGRVARSLASPHVTVQGKVPDVRPYIEKASVVCCPVLTGAGTRNKILQAWAVGRPVVSTSQGAEGLEYSDGKDLIIADTAEAFSAAVLELLRNTALRNALVQGGAERIRTLYAMNVIAGTLQQYICDLAARYPAYEKASPFNDPHS